MLFHPNRSGNVLFQSHWKIRRMIRKPVRSRGKIRRGVVTGFRAVFLTTGRQV